MHIVLFNILEIQCQTWQKWTWLSFDYGVCYFATIVLNTNFLEITIQINKMSTQVDEKNTHDILIFEKICFYYQMLLSLGSLIVNIRLIPLTSQCNNQEDELEKSSTLSGAEADSRRSVNISFNKLVVLKYILEISGSEYNS